MKKGVKIALIIVLILIIVVFVLLVFIKKRELGNSNTVVTEEDSNQMDEGKVYEDNNNGFKQLEDPNVFFSISNALNNYLNVLNYRNSDASSNIYNIQDDTEQSNALLSLLDESYIRDNDINNQNINNYVEAIDYTYKIIPIDIRVRYDTNILVYILHVYLENLDNMSIQDRYYIIRVDNSNGTFSVKPVSTSINDIDDVRVNVSNASIEKNDYNAYDLETISIERMVKIYMDTFTDMELNYPEIAYNNYLDDEYKTKRFGSLENFESYVSSNRDEISSVRATKYLSEDDTDYTKYVIMDQYNNTYEFYQTTTMNFKVRLDTYTIPSEEFISTYNNGTNQTKVNLNIDKWIQMLNNRDYNAAYNALDATFRSNNYGTEEQFEAYMRENFPLHYQVEYTSLSDEGGIYSEQITLSDSTGKSSDTISLTIIMQLKDASDFVMSFSIE